MKNNTVAVAQRQTYITVAEFSNMQRQQLKWNDRENALKAVNLLRYLNRLIRKFFHLGITDIADHKWISLNSNNNISIYNI